MNEQLQEVMQIAIKTAQATKDLNAQQRADFVYNAIADLDNGIPLLGLVPDEYEVVALKKAVAEVKEHLPQLIKKEYLAIKHLFHK